MARADQGSLINSGGSASATSGVSITSAVASPAGGLTLSCPATTTGACSGGSFSFASNDGATTITAAFTSGTYKEGCYGGGRGGHVTCSFTFIGNFSGVLTVNSSSQAIIGVTTQVFGTTGAESGGYTAYNSAYTPFYYSDSEQILRSDDLKGTNQIAFGSQGSGVGNFYGAYGIALDSAGRIYVADTYNCRIVRIDDMLGTNWTEYDSAGGCGSGTGQVYEPTGIAVDSTGHIYVTDPYNAQLIRMDDLTGANWTVFNSIGGDIGQLSTFTNVTVDPAGHIYIADTGNRRIVRMDDMAATNFTALSQSPQIGSYIYSFASPVAVTVDSTGEIYVADNAYQPSIIRVDDMTGANWTSIAVTGNGLNSIAVDSAGSVFAGGGGVRIVDGMAGVLNSSGSVAPYGSYYVFGTTPVPLPTPRPSAVSFSPSTLSLTANVGASSSLPLTVTNFGGSPLSISVVSATGPFTDTTDCLGTLIAGATCTITATFTPTAQGPATGQINISDDSFNLGPTQAIPLTGTGTGPTATFNPSSLSFPSQTVGSTSSAEVVILQSIGPGTLTVTSVAATPPFNQTSNCSSVPAGSTCSIAVTFSPTANGSASGVLTIMDDSGAQTVALTGSGISDVSVAPNFLQFGSLPAGSTSAALSVTLTNLQAVPLNFSDISPIGPFLITTNTCGASIAPGAACTIGIQFSPYAIGAASGTLTFTDDAASSPQTVGLSGTGSESGGGDSVGDNLRAPPGTAR
jgi:sugar lactone lactonase YvrE